MMNAYIYTEIKQHWATLALGWARFMCLMALWLMLVDQNPFWPSLYRTQTVI